MNLDHLGDRRGRQWMLSRRFGHVLVRAVFQYQDPGSSGRKHTLDGLKQLVLGFSVNVVAMKLLTLGEHGTN